MALLQEIMFVSNIVVLIMAFISFPLAFMIISHTRNIFSHDADIRESSFNSLTFLFTLMVIIYIIGVYSTSVLTINTSSNYKINTNLIHTYMIMGMLVIGGSPLFIDNFIKLKYNNFLTKKKILSGIWLGLMFSFLYFSLVLRLIPQWF